MPNYKRQIIRKNHDLGVYSYATIAVILIVAAILLVHSLTSKEQREIAKDEVDVALDIEQRQAVINRLMERN